MISHQSSQERNQTPKATTNCTKNTAPLMVQSQSHQKHQDSQRKTLDLTQYIATTNDKKTKATPLQPDKPDKQPALIVKAQKRPDAKEHLRIDFERATPEVSTPNPTVPHQNVAAHHVPHVLMSNTDTPKTPFLPYTSIPNQTPRDKRKPPNREHPGQQYSPILHNNVQPANKSGNPTTRKHSAMTRPNSPSQSKPKK